jgi:hypothetical protein
MKISINRRMVNLCSLLLVTGLSSTAFAASKDIVTGDIRESNAKTTVIAKAPTDLNFKSLDIDADGKITLKEAIKDMALANKFNETDVNHDGVITVDEYAMYTSKSEKATTVN